MLCYEQIMGIKYGTIFDQDVLEKHREIMVKLGTEGFEAVCFVMGTNDILYGTLKKYLAHGVNLGRDDYPRTIQAR